MELRPSSETDSSSDTQEIPIILWKSKVRHSVHKSLPLASILFNIVTFLMTATGFGLVFGFINHLQVVTAINYHTVPAFHATNHSTVSLS
jgi:hypothetical protein